MKINKIEIQNFRGFENYAIDFAQEITVLIGRNGAGKTTLVDAIHKAMSFIFSNDKSLGKDFLSAGNPALKVNSYETSDFHFDSKTREVAEYVNIKTQATYSGNPLNWQMYKKSTSGAALYQSMYKEAFLMFMNLWKEQKYELPLLAYYSDSFPHKNIKETNLALQTISNDIIPRNFGYYKWDDKAACTSIWESRLCDRLAKKSPIDTQMVELNRTIVQLEESSSEQHDNSSDIKRLEVELMRYAANARPLITEISFIKNRLSQFASLLPTLKGEGYDIDYLMPVAQKDGYQLNIVFRNGKRIPFQELPAGYRRLYSIVFDMAYRAYILNGAKEPSGIVLIDEVDLHLHPSLEQDVVQALHDTFPDIQFILTTHSAAVIANLNTSSLNNDEYLNKVLFMQEGQDRASEVPNIYGLDYNSALRDFMDTPSSSQEIRLLIEKYLFYYAQGLKDESDILYNDILHKLGSEQHPLIAEIEKKKSQYEVHR